MASHHTRPTGSRNVSVNDPTQAIRTASDAMSAAAAVMREITWAYADVAMRDPDGIWRAYAEMPLAGLLYAASPAGCGGGIAWAARALDNTDPDSYDEPGWGQVAQLCRHHVVLLRAVTRTIDLDDRQRDSILLVLHDVFDYLIGGGATGWTSPLTV